ncbi:hypothetical protein PABG_11336 [Paracoccidioides brasiliensis Pb03]|nr:hypothetical protein PABG_11336 [Paracoccidioides brasiliensis Pb03]
MEALRETVSHFLQELFTKRDAMVVGMVLKLRNPEFGHAGAIERNITESLKRMFQYYHHKIKHMGYSEIVRPYLQAKILCGKGMPYPKDGCREIKRCRSKSAALPHKTHKTEAPRQSN